MKKKNMMYLFRKRFKKRFSKMEINNKVIKKALLQEYIKTKRNRVKINNMKKTCLVIVKKLRN